MSVGLAMVVAVSDAKAVQKHVIRKGINCYAIGRIIKGNKTVATTGQLPW